MQGERVNRFDVSEIGKPTRTPQGFLRVPAFLTRAGVFEYRRQDGSIARELRHPDEVFKADSLATISAAPVTDLHPKEMVNPKNVRSLAIGHVSETVRKDGVLVGADVIVEDDAAIAAVERGDRREISCGYKCRVDQTAGEWNGQRYDAVQRDIVYNHAALGPRNWGRAGAEVALRLDSGDAMTADAFAWHEPRTDSGEEDMDQTTLRIDNIDVTVPKQWAQVIELGIKRRDDALGAMQKERDTAQGRADGLAKEVDELKKKLETADDPKRLDSAVEARVKLIESARKILPPEHKFDGQSTRQIHEATLKRLDDKLDLSKESDEYVRARFDTAIAAAPAPGQRTDSLSSARQALTAPPAAKSGTTPPQQQQRQDAYVPPWRQPLASNKQD